MKENLSSRPNVSITQLPSTYRNQGHDGYIPAKSKERRGLPVNVIYENVSKEFSLQ